MTYSMDDILYVYGYDAFVCLMLDIMLKRRVKKRATNYVTNPCFVKAMSQL